MHPNSQLLFAVRRVAILSLLIVVASWCPLIAQDIPQPVDVSVGIGGYAKLGHWVPVQFKIVGQTSADKATRFRATVLDGDDTPSTIIGPVVKTEDGFQAVVQIGRTYGDSKFELLDDDGEVLANVEAQILKDGNQFMKLIPSTGRLFACVEKPVADGEASISEGLDLAFPGGVTEDDQVVSIPLSELPQTGIAYESCDSLILLANDSQWLAEMQTESIDAIETWVQNGGNLVIAASAREGALFQTGGLLERFTPGEIVGEMDLDSSRRLGEFCSSKVPYLSRGETMRILKIENADGRVALKQGKIPLIVRRPMGLGEVTFIAFDPTEKRFRDWKASSRFMQSLMKLRIGDENTQPSNDAPRTGSAVRHSGYKDLVGQMKVPLERFTSLRFIPFALIAVLIGLYVLCISAGDWFLVGRAFKKHELTWITFPLLAALFCGIAWYAAKASRPSTIQLNQVELIDIDSMEGHVRTTTWSNLYSPDGRTVDLDLGVQANAAEGLGLELGSSRLGWLGLPGDGLGGMLNRANPGLYRTGYVQQIVSETSNPADVSYGMKGVALQVSSTRPLFGQWNGEFNNRVTSRLRMTDRLNGTFTNPFDVPLKDCRLFFGDLVYVIKGTLPADGDIDISSDTSEKTVRSYLTRRTSRVDDKNKSQSIAWNPRDVNLSRILQMMMFFHGSGGSSYTGLTHSYHDFIEMTPQCSMDRAVLVGRIDDRVSSININGADADELYDSSLTMVRVLLPVERKNEKR